MRRLRTFRILRITAFTTAFLAAAVLAMIPQGRLPLYSLSAFLYLAVTVSWALTVARRIYLPALRRQLLVIAVLLSSLFVLQASRDTFFAYDPGLSKMLWLAMYLPCVFVPVLSCIALYGPGADRGTATGKKQVLRLIPPAVLGALILTDPLHHMFFVSSDPGTCTFSPSHLFFVTIVWIFLFSLAALFLLVRSTRASAVQHLWYFPAAFLAAGLLLVLLYAASGGPPVLKGVRLYHLPEAFAFMYISFFETAIRVGLIPSNSGYESLFFLSGMGGLIRNDEGEILFRSRKYQSQTDDPDHPLMTVPIRGGSFSWRADRTSIHELNEAIREATEQIENENDLVEQERRVNEERMRYETQNRLYDRIAVAVRPQILKIEALLQQCEENPENTASRMRLISVLGTFIKRRGNLMLVADESREASTDELVFALRESFESLSLSGVFTHLEAGPPETVPVPLLIAAYDLFEDIVEPLLPTLSAVTAQLSPHPDFSVTFCASADHNPIRSDWNKERLAAVGAVLLTDFEDDTCRVCLRAGREVSV